MEKQIIATYRGDDPSWKPEMQAYFIQVGDTYFNNMMDDILILTKNKKYVTTFNSVESQKKVMKVLQEHFKLSNVSPGVIVKYNN